MKALFAARLLTSPALGASDLAFDDASGFGAYAKGGTGGPVIEVARLDDQANDMRRGDDYAVQMEAVNNLMFDYQRSGSRYTTGIEDHKDEGAEKGYQFQFIGNAYLGDPRRPAIEAVMKHEVHAGIRVHADDNTQIKLSDTQGRESLMDAARVQIQPEPLFTTSATLAAKPKLEKLLTEVGCSHARDSADLRIIEDVRSRRFHPPIRSQEQVGGWPVLE